MNTSQQQLERIVAYLDGELSAEESAQVEQRLAADETFRQELQGAQRAWTALDELPMSHVGEDFSRTTMEMVVSAARQDVQARTIALPVQQRKRKTTTVALAAMAVLLGALFFRVLWNNPNRRLIADLPVIQNVDIYSQFRSVDFLQQLHSLQSDHVEISTEETEQRRVKLEEFLQVSADDGREDWLELLSDDEKIALRAKLNRFRDLSSQRQSEMRQLHQQLHSADDREQLLETMFRYQQWLVSLPPSEQFELRKLPSSEHVRQVAQQMRQDLSNQKFTLTKKQLQEVLVAVKPYVEKIVKKRSLQISSQKRANFRSWSDQQRMRELFSTLRKSPEHMEKLNELVISALPEDVRREFRQLSPWEKGPVVVSWLRQARAQSIRGLGKGPGQRPGEVLEQELADFFAEELETADKERLLVLPRDEMQRQLERMYRGQMFRRDRHDRPPGWEGRPPHLPGPKPEGERHGRFDDRRRSGPPPHGPRGGPGLEDGRGHRPRRDFDRKEPRRRPSKKSPLNE